MRVWQGVVREVCLGPFGRGAWIYAPPGAIPAPGQYVMGWAPEDTHSPTAEALFPAGYKDGAFLVAAPVPQTWEPGTKIILRGPIGKGYQLPGWVTHLVVAALGQTVERLLPILSEAIEHGCSVVVCTDCTLPNLPAEVEYYPECGLVEILPWANFLMMDLPRSQLSLFRSMFAKMSLPDGQVLLSTIMPCGGLGECGVCAVQGNRSVKFICKNGPVFPLHEFF